MSGASCRGSAKGWRVGFFNWNGRSGRVASSWHRGDERSLLFFQGAVKDGQVLGVVLFYSTSEDVGAHEVGLKRQKFFFKKNFGIEA